MNNEKRELIARILDNPVYSAESGLYKELARGLSVLSNRNLAGLEIIIKMREGSASRRQALNGAKGLR